MKSDFHERLRSLMNERDIRQIDLTRAIGAPRQTVSRWLSDMVPRAESVSKIAEYFGVSPQWLLGGDDGSGSVSIPVGDDIDIPQFDVAASCGGGAEGNNAPPLLRMVRVTKQFLQRYATDADQKHLSLISVSGDSMEPTLFDGDSVLVDTSQTVPRDGIYAIYFDSGLFVKRLQRQPGLIRVVSDNPKYSPFDVKVSQMEEMGFRVIGRCYVTAALKRI